MIQARARCRENGVRGVSGKPAVHDHGLTGEETSAHVGALA